MEDNLHKRVIGQDEGIRAISDAIRRSRGEDQNRPIGSFMFWGLRVLKTETAKALAEFLFDNGHAMVQI